MGCPRRSRRLTPCRIPCLMPRLPDDFDDDDGFDPDHPLAAQPADECGLRALREGEL